MASGMPHTLAAKIIALPEDRIAEVEDFVDFLGQREVERGLSSALCAASTPAFADVWSNPADDVYDVL